jgi:nucleoside-diphosphate-sugar epimerase
LQIFDRVAKKSGWYPGGQTGYVDVRDLANFIGLILEKNKYGERWVLNAENLSYEKIYRMIGQALGLQKKFRLAPRWLANIILSGISLMTGKQLGKEILAPAYAPFRMIIPRVLNWMVFHTGQWKKPFVRWLKFMGPGMKAEP